MSKKYVIALVSVVVAIVIAVSGYFYWTNSPQYSLAQISKAVDTKDRQLFEKHVDIDNILESALKDIGDFYVAETAGELNAEVPASETEALAEAMTAMIAPVLTEAIAESLNQYWQATDDEPVDNDDDLGINKKDIEQVVESAEILYIKRGGDTAELGIELTDADSGKKTTLEFLLIKADGYWVVSKVSNLRELLDEDTSSANEFLGGS